MVLPALLAAAEDAGPVEGREFLLAFALGVEMAARFGLACPGGLAAGWHPTSLFGTLAASLAAGRMLRLDAERMRDALGLAFHQAGGSIQSAYDGAIGKRVGPGFAARDAVFAAFLARDGITGPTFPLEGKAGFFALQARGEGHPQALSEGLGELWRITEYSLKPYPACRAAHAAIGIAARLREEGIDPSQVKSVDVAMSESNWRLVGAPYDAGRDSVVHAQFNAAYGFARALLDGRVGPAAYQRPAIAESPVARLAQRIRVRADPGIDAAAMSPVLVELSMNSGKKISRRADTVKGDPAEPMSERELLEKLRGCLEFGGYPIESAEKIVRVTGNLENERNAATALVAAFP